MADLDSLLVDLESTLERRGGGSGPGERQHGMRTTRLSTTGARHPGDQGGRTMAAALGSNLNELDHLLQDLSAARYSSGGHHQGTEAERSVSTTSHSSSSTERYYELSLIHI